MNETYSEINSPLARLLNDDNITIMEGIIPHCPPHLGRVLAVEMKLMEIRKILNCFDDEPSLKACGFEEQTGDMESILRSIRNSVSEEKARQIDSVLSMIRFSKMYQTYQEILQSHPELLKGQERRSGEKESSDAFSDPSLFFLLNSMMNNNEDNGSGNDKMKTLIDFATKAGGENRDFSELLSSLLKQ